MKGRRHAMKRGILAVVLSLNLIIMTGLPVLAEENETSHNVEMCYQSPNNARSIFSVGEPIDEALAPRARAATITVNVTSPCDTEFRQRYSDWAYQANRAVERADDGLYKLYGIDYRSVAQRTWSSSGADMSALIKNAVNVCGLTYNGNLKADLMIAFTGKTVDSGVLGIASVKEPYALVKDGGYDQNAACAQHESCHTYGCSHEGTQWDNDTACIMYRYLNLWNIDKFCTSHYNVMTNNKNKY